MNTPVATIICERCLGILELRGTAFTVYGTCSCGQKYEFAPHQKNSDALDALEFIWTE